MGLNAPAAAARHRVGGEFWYANTDVASRPAGNASRSVVGLGGAGVELGVRVVPSPQWKLQTSGTAMYQDVYAGSTTSGAWTWHVGLGYRFGS